MPPKLVQNIANKKAEDLKRKTVYKPILDNSFVNPLWPLIDKKDVDKIVELLLYILAPLKPYNDQQKALNLLRKKKRIDSKKKKKNNNKKDSENENINEIGNNNRNFKNEITTRLSRPTEFSYISLGFNETNSEIENQIQYIYNLIGENEVKSGGKMIIDIKKKFEERFPHPIIAVLICESQNSLLARHFPFLAASSSIYPEITPIKLIQLPKEMEGRISNSIGVSPTSIIGLRGEYPYSHQLKELINSVSPVIAPWISHAPFFQETQIKFVKTSQPDLKFKSKK